MAIRDRGKLKWQPASFLPLAFEMQRSMFKDQERLPKPLIDENQSEEFDQRICYAMENNLAVRFTVWNEGFTEDFSGHVHYVDSITHQLRIEVQPGKFERIEFGNVIGLAVIDS
ncbi:YolD-like family protein [Neobacillus sp. GCM10023253]|uniref:YolD-like family protein n=1 Tax=Neobacillus sp. GCM10023253 TaxID=3252644 RepID=UPI00366C6CF3